MSKYIDTEKADVEQISCFYGAKCRLEDVRAWLDEQEGEDVVPREQIQQLFTDIDTALENEAFDFGTRMRIKIYLKNLKQKYLGGNDNEVQ